MPAQPYNQDFVELYNNSSANVDISGYSLQYAAATTATPTAFTVCTITASDTVIEPGTYFLIATGNASATVGKPLPTPNANCSLTLAAGMGKVALTSGTGRLDATTCPPTAPAGTSIVDFVGYGNTATTAGFCFEGAGPAPTPSATLSVQRTPIGNDTNNNSADFTTGAPSPMAAATTAAPPSFAINNVTQAEGNSGTTNFVFTVTKTGTTSSSSTVTYTTANGTATAGSDYTATSGTLTFAAGDTTMTITVPVTGDTTVESDETFTVTITAGTNATISKATGTGTITNDDTAPANSAPTVTANPTAQTITGGGTGTSTITITDEDAATVALTGTSNNQTLVPNANVSFSGTGANRTLTVTPAAGQTGTATITVTATDAGGLTGTTTYTLTVNAAANPTVSLSVSSNTAAESTPAGTPITVTATASSPVATAQTVNVGVSGAGVTSGDFTLSNTTITIPANATSGSVTFTVNDDNIAEGTETATLTISNPSPGITLGSPTSQNITITDNETNNTTTVVSPANMNGFVFFPEGPTGSFSTGTFVRDPGQPPLGMGSARFTIDDTGREALATFAFANTRLDAITELSYSAYQNRVTNPSTPPNTTVTLQFDVDFNLSDANNAFQGRLVFEPAANGIPVTPNTFQTFNALDPTTGRFFATNQTASGGNCTQANPCTKAQLLALFPNVGIRNSQFGGLILRAGGPVPGGFDGNADALTIAVNGNRTTFDFEPSSTTVVVSPTNMRGFAFVQEDLVGSGAFVVGPPMPPLGFGSAQLTVDGNGRELLLTQQYAGTRLDAITQLQYSAYQINPANPQVTLTLQFDVDFNLNDADTSFQGRVVYEPSVNGITPQQGMFQTFDATNGKFYFSRTPPGAATNPCTQASPCTRAQVLAAFPNAGIRFVAAGAPNNGILAIMAGGPVAGGFTGNVDALVVGINNVNTVFDFEAAAPATAAAVNVGGRVTTSSGRGIFRAIVKMTDGAGIVRTAYTNIFGYYHFAEVEVGQTLIFDLKHKGYNFREPTRIVSLTEETVSLNFTAY